MRKIAVPAQILMDDLASGRSACDNVPIALPRQNIIQNGLRQDQMRINRSALRVAPVALVIALLGMPAAAQPLPTSALASNALAAVHIFNFGQISQSYYRGGELKNHDALDLAQVGVKTVIDLRSDGDYDPAEAQLVADAHMQYVRLPMTTRTAPTAAQISKFLTLVNDPANQPVYVHCVEGRHRTGVMTAVYRMSVDKWDAKRAFDEMKHYKFGMDFLHPEFKEFVFGYRPVVAPVPALATAAVTPAPVPVTGAAVAQAPVSATTATATD